MSYEVRKRVSGCEAIFKKTKARLAYTLYFIMPRRDIPDPRCERGSEDPNLLSQSKRCENLQDNEVSYIVYEFPRTEHTP